MKNIDTSLFKSFVEDVKQKIKAAQYKALQAVNKEQIALYWDIGRLIVERQEQYGWGKSIVENLAKELQADFSDSKGFSSQNLWYMRQFFTEYSKSELLQPLVGEINWTKHLIIIAKCKDEHQRFFYIEMTRRHSWSKSALIQAIEGKMWEKTVINQQNFNATLPRHQGENAALVLKDEYTFDFLDLSEPYTEQQLELALLSNIRNFLASMGGDFAFIGNQFGVKVDGKNYEIDLLLYHRALQCLVAIDLKIDDFKA
jgi:predicted nuclease of restriction endonuclease-like (RecB) superfamily